VVHRLQFPLVRIIDVTDRALFVTVDGKPVTRVEPSSAESPHAGVSVRLPSGTRRLVATDPSGVVVDEVEVVVLPGRAHLYAPGSQGTCFWLETAGYGRSRGDAETRVPVAGEVRFWALPEDVDLWFARPPPADADGRSTGGLVRAIRQARCSEAPADVR
jgi:hypothetical protein